MSHAYPGNKPDVTQFPEMIETLAARHAALAAAAGQGGTEMTVVFDAGQNSEANFALLAGTNLHYVGSVPASDCRDLLALPAAVRSVVDEGRFGQLTAYDTRRAVYGTRRRVILTHSPELHAHQARGFDGTTLAKAGRKLDELAATLARGKTRRPRATVETEIGKITHDPWVRRVITWQLAGEQPADLRLTWDIDQPARAALEEEIFGKHVLITDHDDWPAAEVIAGYRSQSEAEFSFRQMKDPRVVSFSPMFHWTEHNIRVHVLTCVLALQTAHLLRLQAGRAGLHMSVRGLLRQLAGIGETVLIYPAERGRPKARRMLTETTDARRLQFGADLELTFRTLIGTGANPNVAAAIVIGIEPTWTDRVADGIAATGKPVERFSVERHGDLRTVEAAARAAARLVQDASEARREPVDRDELLMSIKCGESDTTSGLGSCPTTAQVVDRHVAANGTVLFGETSELTGGEQLIAERCVDDEVRKRFQDLYDRYLDRIEAEGANLLGSQPTQGNIRGGLSTIEEKAMGNIAKTGTAPVVEALGPAEPPTRRGLCFMDTSSAAAECITLMAAAGAVVHLFPTGQGNIIGHPIEPVVKLTANPVTAETMAEHMDLDCSGLLRRDYDLTRAGDLLGDVVDRTVNGRLTCAEVLGHREFTLTKLYPSA
ncbi:MAG: IS1634 family transposase [Streptosporangiaceae bacterium]